METWESVQIATLQKMFLIDGNVLTKDTKTLPYLTKMPQAVNEALQILSTAGKFIAKHYDITQDGTGTGLIQRYNFKELVDDFYDFRDVYLDDGETYRKVAVTTEGQGILTIPTESIGTWRVYYNAYPQQITKNTEDSTELSLDPEVVALLPLYMASQLYKDDDIGLATQWRNEFEVARGELRPSDTSGTVEFYTPETINILARW